jgi:hypothetical protein
VTLMLDIPALSLIASVVPAPGSIPGVLFGGGLIPLRAAFGQDEASHGAVRYLVDDDGLIRVPLEAVDPLMTIGGFVMAQTCDSAISVGVLTLHHDDAAGCSYGGRQFLGDSNGDVLVPAEAASELLAHGFVPVFRDVKSLPSNRSKKA